MDNQCQVQIKLVPFKVNCNDREIERQTDRQTARQTDRHTDRQTEKKTDRQMDSYKNRSTHQQNRETEKKKQLESQTDRQSDANKFFGKEYYVFFLYFQRLEFLHSGTAMYALVKNTSFLSFL